jgi:hypothetical protein
MSTIILPPENSGDFVNFSDTVWINLNGWRPQLSIRNCNKAAMWGILTTERESKFHCLERIRGNEKRYFQFYFPTQQWVESQDPALLADLINELQP